MSGMSEMKVIKTMHLLFAEHLPEQNGAEIITQCGQKIPFEGSVPRDMVDSRLCKKCVEKINGYSVLSGTMRVKCFAVLEFGKGNYGEFGESSLGN